MQRKRTIKTIIHACLPLVFLLCSILPGFTAEITELDLITTLVDACSWSDSLLDEENVSVMTYQDFDTFRGRGWLHGTKEAQEVHSSLLAAFSIEL